MFLVHLIVSKLHECGSAGWALCSSATCVLFFWRGPKGTSSLVPKQVWQSCWFCGSCKSIPFVSRKILRNALRWKDKSWAEMQICERNAFGNIMVITQLSWWTKKTEKLELLAYSNEIISGNYCSWSSKYSFTIAILIKNELRLTWYHNDINRSFLRAIVANILLCYVSCHYKDDLLGGKLHHFFQMDLVLPNATSLDR